MTDLDFSEQQWLAFSERMFRLIVSVHDTVRDFLAEPIWFEHIPDPVEGKVHFRVWYQHTPYENKSFKFTMRVDDYLSDEIEAVVELAYHSADVWRP